VFSKSKEDGNISTSYNKSITTIPSITIKPTGAVGKSIDFTVNYTSSVPTNDIINFTLGDNLGNFRSFSIDAVTVNNVKIIGASKGENKIIESKIGNGAKINIKATQQKTKTP